MKQVSKFFRKAGEIEIKSGYVVASDPCYQYKIWCSHVVKAMNGRYDVLIAENNEGNWFRVAALAIVLQGKEAKGLRYVPGECGVDSGTCGFFDKDYYRKTHKEDVEDAWYNENVVSICYNNPPHICVDDNDVPLGVLSDSGFGDGSYPLYGARENGEYYALMVVFIDDDNEIVESVEG